MTAPDTPHSIVIKDHPYEPRDPNQPWGLCKCGLSQACHERTVGPYLPTSPPAGPPSLPPNARLAPPPEEDEVNPLPVPEISLTEMQEYVVKEEEMKCWRCGTRDGVHKLENGAILCVPCVEILKP